MNQGTKLDQRDPLNPSYCAAQLFSSPSLWARDAAAKLKKWGFNTVGAWSDHELLRETQAGLYQTPILHLGTSGIPWKDMWDPSIVAQVYQLAQEGVARSLNDPNTIGYFSDNELGWWAGAMFEWAWKAGPEHGTRDRWVKLLRTQYDDNWPRVLKDFEPEGASGFDELSKAGSLFLHPGGNGMDYVRRVLGVLADRYYELCRDAVHRADPRALFLGDRYISNFYPEVAEAAGRYCDVVSTNINASWNDGTCVRWYLDALHASAKKPLMVTEYYAAAMDNRSGNLNDSSGFPTVRNQRERTRSYERQIQRFLEEPFVVGAHWFQFYDERRHGRGDGENYNMGLVDVFGAPYESLTRAMSRTRPETLHRRLLPKREDALEGVPRIDPFDARDLGRWPKDQAYLPPFDGVPRGDLYLAWCPSALFVALHWDEDRFAEAFYRDGTIPDQDRPRFVMSWPGARTTVEGRLGLGGGLDLRGVRGLAHESGTRNTAVFRIAATEFGKAALEQGQSIRLTASLSTRGRAYTMGWRANVRLSEKRSNQ